MQTPPLVLVMWPVMHAGKPTPYPHLDKSNDRRLWKHYLPATTVVGGKNNKMCLWFLSLLNGIIGLFSLWTHLEAMSLSLSPQYTRTLRQILQTIITVLKKNFCFSSPKEHGVKTFSSKKQAKQHIVTKPVDVYVISEQRIKITAWTLLLCLPTD